MNKTFIKYNCLICKTKIHWQTALYGKGMCKSCSHKDLTGEKNSNYKYGLYSDNPNKCIDCDKRISYSSKRCFKCYGKIIKGKNNPAYNSLLHIPNHCIDCGILLRTPNSKRCWSCASKLKIKKGITNIGKINYCRNVKYKNIWMRSTWEKSFAQFLTLSGIKWKYEFVRFDLGNTAYTPDFYLPEFDCYIEVKGYWRKEAKRKMRRFKKIYNCINLYIFNQEKLTEIGVLK